MLILKFFILSFLGAKSWAYPNFIGYGYNTCTACHYNVQGGGPLTDYGRALFSQEIAARPFVDPATSDEDLAQKSGFIPGKELPSWFRPSIKYRGLWLQVAPQSSRVIERWIDMQRDFNVVFAADPGKKTILSLTASMLPSSKNYYGYGDNVEWVSREHYVRFYPMRNLSISAGLMDKVYGLRIVDHTAVNRSGLGLGQDDQVHGVYTQWSEKEWDLGVHLFAGNLLKEKDLRQEGISLFSEYDYGVKNRVGLSAMFFSMPNAKAKRVGVHDRWGLPHSPGSSLMGEIGWKENEDLIGATTMSGSYGYVELLLNLRRGYNLLSTVERSQAELRPSSPEIQRWTLGFLLFPLQRTEVRTTIVQTKYFSSETISADTWALQGQVHVSW